MKPSDLTKALEHLVKLKQSTVLWGECGIGKSQIISQLAERLNVQLKDVRAVLLDAVDLRGLPMLQDGKAKWAIPDFLPTEGEGILFLDELNRAPILVQNACFQLVLDRKLGDYNLPDDWAIIAACNNTGGGITKMPDALRNRFVHLQAETDVNDWCNWAVRAGIEPITIAFIRFRPDLLHKFDGAVNAFPSPRSWEFVSKITASDIGGHIEHELFAGAVGSGAAVEYSAFIRLFRELPNIDSILLNPAKAPIPSQPATLFAVASALARYATANNFGRVIQYLNRLPDEYAVMSVKDAILRDSTLTSTPEFTKWAVKNQEILS